jgi:juvenile-hormone esterase
VAFIHPLYKSVKQYVAKADFVTHPVSLYKFEFKGPLSYSVLYTGSYKDYGVVHCDELIYLFRSPAIFPVDFDKKSMEADMIRVLTNYFADFATNG